MIEIAGNLWDLRDDNHVICITTNGFVKKNGEAVMGRGCALEAVQRDSTLPFRLGQHIRAKENVPMWLSRRMVSFPVKHNWWEAADLVLIQESAYWLLQEAKNLPQLWFVLPRPGCGNGRLKWEDVKPAIDFLPDNVQVINYGR